MLVVLHFNFCNLPQWFSGKENHGKIWRKNACWYGLSIVASLQPRWGWQEGEDWLTIGGQLDFNILGYF